MLNIIKSLMDKVKCLLSLPCEIHELNRSIKSLQEKLGPKDEASLLSDFRAFHSVLSFDTMHGLQMKAREEAVVFIQENLGEAKCFRSREEVLEHALAQADPNGIYCEFGVATGKSINFISSKVKTTVYGFDSFEGMPEKWNAWEAGSLSQDGKMPVVNSNVHLVKGLFADTIKKAKELFLGSPVSFCHIDCDLYSSTRLVLSNLAELFTPGTILVFDEFYNHPTWRECEYKAWIELAAALGITFEYLGYNAYESSVSLRILSIEKSKAGDKDNPEDAIIKKKYYSHGKEISLSFFSKDIHVINAVFSGNEYPLNKITGYIKPAIIFDVGANVGATALYFASAYPEATVHSFEPCKDAYQLLETNCSAADNIKRYPFGLYGKTCTKEIYLGKHQSAAASIFKSGNSSETKLGIKLVNIQDFIAQNSIGEISILKIDTEGCEVSILKALSSLDKIGYVFFEYHSENDRMELDKFLTEKFYLFFCNIHRPHRGTCGYVSKRITGQFPELIEEPIRTRNEESCDRTKK